jgi:hypothetical protein
LFTIYKIDPEKAFVKVKFSPNALKANEGYMGTLVVDFGAYGLWRYHAKDKTWDLLSGLSPDEILNRGSQFPCRRRPPRPALAAAESPIRLIEGGRFSSWPSSVSAM